MAPREFLFTSESVTEGHPDKIADQVSDTVLDAVLADDPNGRVACETLITTGLVVVAGEITTETYVDIPAIVRKRIAEIGYTHSEWGFDAHTCGVVAAIDEQSPDIAQGVDSSYETQHDPADDPLDQVGAGDQGMMFGYATRETPELMPLPIMLAHKICKRLAEVRKVGDLPYLRPDGKAQVTVRYEVDDDGHQSPVEIERILVSTQHAEGCDAETLIKPDLIERVLHPILPSHLYDEKRLQERDFVYVNPTGKFVIGGPMGDTGLTGRKIIVDTYGGAARHGGGAFSGKDPTKVDRSAAYAARYVAKNVVAAELADRCEVNVAYAIGVAKPVSIAVRTFGSERIPMARIEELIDEHFDLRPGAILRDLDLRRPIYAKTAAYGHFGRDDHDFTLGADGQGRCAPLGGRDRRRVRLGLGGPHEQAGRGLLGDRLLVAVQPHRQLLGRRLRLAHLDVGARDETLVVEPVQKLAVVLGQADDRGARARLELGQRRELAVLGLFEVGVDRPAVGAAVGMAEPLADALDHVVAEALADLVGVHVGLGRGVAHEVGQEPLDDPVLAHHALGPLAPGGGQDRLLVLASLHEALGLETLQHLAGRGTRDAEHLGDP